MSLELSIHREVSGIGSGAEAFGLLDLVQRTNQMTEEWQIKAKRSKSGTAAFLSL